MQAYSEEQALYCIALSLLKGIGQQTLLHLLTAYPTLEDLRQATLQTLTTSLTRSVATRLHQLLHETPDGWEQLYEQAGQRLLIHERADIIPIPMTSPLYPLLKLIADPPPMLYAKGNLDLLQQTKTVAIVGTRDPTPVGIRVAGHLAEHLAGQEFCVVSGLAKGIDTAAHWGALRAQGVPSPCWGLR